MLAPSGMSTATSSSTFSGDTGPGTGNSPSNGWSSTVPRRQEELLEVGWRDEEVVVRAVRDYPVRVLTICGQVDELSSLDKADLALAPPLQGTIHHDECLRFARVHVARGH